MSSSIEKARLVKGGPLCIMALNLGSLPFLSRVGWHWLRMGFFHSGTTDCHDRTFFSDSAFSPFQVPPD